ncbi:thaumatin-like protein [Serendipita vermifera]|nr:thaumatin-like protein [Serendipita vermifera]
MIPTKLSSLLSLLPLVASRNITVHNACPFTIWPAVYTDLNVGTALPDVPTGWEAPAGIWGRRNCDFSTNPGPTSCLTGGCNGGLLCDSRTGTGKPPVTLAEFTFNASDKLDWYDVSLVDGYNLPMSVVPTQGCDAANCLVDLGPDCPEALKGPFDSTGFPVGCKSACEANLSGDPTNSPNCCSGNYDTPATCPPSGVQYYSYFKDNCPLSYAYAYDESSGTALFTCPASKSADYTITFCP